MPYVYGNDFYGNDQGYGNDPMFGYVYGEDGNVYAADELFAFDPNFSGEGFGADFVYGQSEPYFAADYAPGYGAAPPRVVVPRGGIPMRGRPAPRGVPMRGRPAPRPAPRPMAPIRPAEPPPPMAAPSDKFDRLYEEALEGAGNQAQIIEVVTIEAIVTAGATVGGTFTMPQDGVLWTMSVNEEAAQFVRGVQGLVGGEPFLSLTGTTQLQRFLSFSTDRRVKAVEVRQGAPITLTGFARVGTPADTSVQISLYANTSRAALTYARRVAR